MKTFTNTTQTMTPSIDPTYNGKLKLEKQQKEQQRRDFSSRTDKQRCRINRGSSSKIKLWAMIENDNR